MLSVILAALFLAPTGVAPVQHDGVKVQVFVPEGMPIKLEPKFDNTDPSITKYTLSRTLTTKDAKVAMFLVVMVDRNGKIAEGEGSVLRFKSYQLADPMTMATADPNVAKMLVMVEWLETSSGKWVVDNPDQKIPLEAIIAHGAGALPKAKFIPRVQP